MIPVTCRNGEHFTIDPDHIERVEATSDTTLHMVDGVMQHQELVWERVV